MLNGVVYLDLKKAFDPKDHQILLGEKKYQPSNYAIQFLNHIFTQRKQEVFVAGHYSSECCNGAVYHIQQIKQLQGLKQQS